MGRKKYFSALLMLLLFVSTTLGHSMFDNTAEAFEEVQVDGPKGVGTETEIGLQSPRHRRRQVNAIQLQYTRT